MTDAVFKRTVTHDRLLGAVQASLGGFAIGLHHHTEILARTRTQGVLVRWKLGCRLPGVSPDEG